MNDEHFIEDTVITLGSTLVDRNVWFLHLVQFKDKVDYEKYFFGVVESNK